MNANTWFFIFIFLTNQTENKLNNQQNDWTTNQQNNRTKTAKTNQPTNEPNQPKNNPTDFGEKSLSSWFLQIFQWSLTLQSKTYHSVLSLYPSK